MEDLAGFEKRRADGGMCSIWTFLLAGIEAIRMYRVNPYLVIGGQSFPTWATPIAALILTMVLWPSTSALGHLSGLVVGYICMSSLPRR